MSESVRYSNELEQLDEVLQVLADVTADLEEANLHNEELRAQLHQKGQEISTLLSKQRKLEQLVRSQVEEIERISASDVALNELKRKEKRLSQVQNEVEQARQANRVAEVSLASRAESLARAQAQVTSERVQQTRIIDGKVKEEVTLARHAIEKEAQWRIETVVKVERARSRAVMIGGVTIAVMYALLWLYDHTETMHQIREWAASLRGFLAWTRDAVASVYAWCGNFTTEWWGRVLAVLGAVLSVLVPVAIVAAAARWMWGALKHRFSDYHREGTASQRKATSTAIMLVAIPVAVLIARHTPLTWVTWWIITAPAALAIYHSEYV